MRSSLLGLIVVAVVVACQLLSVAGQSNLLTNGDFETGSFSGWTEGGEVDPNDTLVQAQPGPLGGTYVAVMGAYTANNTLSQTVPAVAGGRYNFSFWISNPSTDLPSNFVATARFGNGLATTLYAAFDMATTDGRWVYHSATVTAPTTTSTNVTITLYTYDYSLYFLLDDVSLVIIPNPFVSSSSTGVASSVRGDPQFVGLLGQSFQVHGMDGQVYNLIHDSTGLHVNALFVFLSAGECPAAALVSTACWSHPGSYLGTVGVVSAAGRRVSVVSGAAQSGFSAVAVDGAAVSVGDRAVYSDVSLSYTSSHELTINTGNYQLTLQNSDGFINLAAMRVLQWDKQKSQQAHGLLGQTWRRPAKKGQQVKEIEGEVDEYAEASNELFGGDFSIVSHERNTL